MHDHRQPRASLTRRRFVQGASLASAGLLAGCERTPSRPQVLDRVAQVGVLLGVASPNSAEMDAFRSSMREFGYVEGQNLRLAIRSSEGRTEELSALAAELLREPLDLVVAPSPAGVDAVRTPTTSFPIVFLGITDPVGMGLVESLARPGGNLTGLSQLKLDSKRLEFLKDVVPALSRVAVMHSVHPSSLQEVEDAARLLKVQLVPISPRGPAEFDGAIETASREGADGLLVLADAPYLVHAARIAELALAKQLPSISGYKRGVEAGLLMSYGRDPLNDWRRVAHYVDRILKGTKPADLPVEQPMRFEFIVNVNTLQALGLTFPRHLEPLVTEVIR